MRVDSLLLALLYGKLVSCKCSVVCVRFMSVKVYGEMLLKEDNVVICRLHLVHQYCRHRFLANRACAVWTARPVAAHSTPRRLSLQTIDLLCRCMQCLL